MWINWCAHTSLQVHLDSTLTQFCSKLFEVAQGLQYLHSCNIVHGDLRGVRVPYFDLFASDDYYYRPIFLLHMTRVLAWGISASVDFPMVRGTVLDEEAIFVGWLPN
jgi:serine/threonine protein kinase